ncbi:hypothetical protein C8R47DRAFT_1080190 [Mycena vitilis]|nr:hypothetical protein C8R47DRAFT_1080190 [Mycena vitilis]
MTHLAGTTNRAPRRRAGNGMRVQGRDGKPPWRRRRNLLPLLRFVLDPPPLRARRSPPLLTRMRRVPRPPHSHAPRAPPAPAASDSSASSRCSRAGSGRRAPAGPVRPACVSRALAARAGGLEGEGAGEARLMEESVHAGRSTRTASTGRIGPAASADGEAGARTSEDERAGGGGARGAWIEARVGIASEARICGGVEEEGGRAEDAGDLAGGAQEVHALVRVEVVPHCHRRARECIYAHRSVPLINSVLGADPEPLLRFVIPEIRLLPDALLGPGFRYHTVVFNFDFPGVELQRQEKLTQKRAFDKRMSSFSERAAVNPQQSGNRIATAKGEPAF